MTPPGTDHALAIIKATLNAVPVVGGPLASLISDYIPHSTQIQRDLAFGQLAARVEELGARISMQTVDKEEFAELFKSAYLVIVRSHNESRTRAAVNLLVNLMLSPNDSEKLSYTELDHFARCLDQLSIGAVHLVGLLAHQARKQAGDFADHKNTPIVFAQVRLLMPNVAPDLLMGLAGELDSFNLVHRPGAPAIRTSEYSNYNIEVTPLGMRFVSHALRAAA